MLNFLMDVNVPWPAKGEKSRSSTCVEPPAYTKAAPAHTLLGVQLLEVDGWTVCGATQQRLQNSAL